MLAIFMELLEINSEIPGVEKLKDDLLLFCVQALSGPVINKTFTSNFDRFERQLELPEYRLDIAVDQPKRGNSNEKDVAKIRVSSPDGTKLALIEITQDTMRVKTHSGRYNLLGFSQTSSVDAAYGVILLLEKLVNSANARMRALLRESIVNRLSLEVAGSAREKSPDFSAGKGAALRN